MSQTPRVNFHVLDHQIRMYEGSAPRVEYSLQPSELRSERETRYDLELELTALDFIRDELKEIVRDIEARSRAVANLLDSRV